ncbi:2-oxoacid:ferredoxin oxidoreductase subunit beta [archaeon]|jgi:2-oxoglutarate/2-oxoacid ferredoxin oxidoreductase subunit beta|nr:2-oxoacid:ferredoxin oxidoreductase subunit beta [archaeon]
MTNINTKSIPNWCPGCFNFQILAGFKNFILKEIKKGRKAEDFAIVTGIGCHGKMFDYVKLNGINALHGRSLPTAVGVKIGNPNLEVYSFSGDGGSYSEGISHLIHAAKENMDVTQIVHNNQVFALTVGQPTSVTEKGFRDKTMPEGVKDMPLNPIKLMLASGAGFVARVFADVKQIEWVLREAKKHKGFKFIEIIQPCVIFHPDKGYKEKTYMLQDKKHDSSDWNKAIAKASEWDYNGVGKGDKIALGIFYKAKKPTFIEKHWQLGELVKKGKSWRDVKR